MGADGLGHLLPTTIPTLPTVPTAGTGVATLFPPVAAAHLRAWAARHQLDLTVTGHMAFRPSLTRLQPGMWTVLDGPGGRSVVDPDLTRALVDDLPVQVVTPAFALPPAAASAAATVLAGHTGRTLEDEGKLSLAGLSDGAVQVRHASYLDGVVTNFSAHEIETPDGVWDAAAHAARLDGSVADIGSCSALSEFGSQV